MVKEVDAVDDAVVVLVWDEVRWLSVVLFEELGVRDTVDEVLFVLVGLLEAIDGDEVFVPVFVLLGD